MAIATPVAQAAAKLSIDTPIIFSAVSDPVGAKLTNSLEKPDKNITGTSDEKIMGDRKSTRLNSSHCD